MYTALFQTHTTNCDQFDCFFFKSVLMWSSFQYNTKIDQWQSYNQNMIMGIMEKWSKGNQPFQKSKAKGLDFRLNLLKMYFIMEFQYHVFFSVMLSGKVIS